MVSSPIKQEKFPTFQFSCSPTALILSVLSLGIICIGIGILLTNGVNAIVEYKYEYTSEQLNSNFSITRKLPEFNVDVFVYYQLEGFYQLQLSMRESYDVDHFIGADYSYTCNGGKRRHTESDDSNDTFFSFLNWFNPTSLDNQDEKRRAKEPAPCGVRANLFFSDKIEIVHSNGTLVAFHNNKNITWDDDFNFFNNPTNFYNQTDQCSSFIDPKTNELYTKPMNWNKRICEMEGVMQNEDFIAWMKPAYAPTFSKPWKKLNLIVFGYENGYPACRIENNWSPVPLNITLWNQKPYLIKKHVIISTVNRAGGKKNFLGIAYLIVGILLLFIGCAMIIIPFIRSLCKMNLVKSLDGESVRSSINCCSL